MMAGRIVNGDTYLHVKFFSTQLARSFWLPAGPT